MPNDPSIEDLSAALEEVHSQQMAHSLILRAIVRSDPELQGKLLNYIEWAQRDGHFSDMSPALRDAVFASLQRMLGT